jgi:hypothetical protein
LVKVPTIFHPSKTSAVFQRIIAPSACTMRSPAEHLMAELNELGMSQTAESGAVEVTSGQSVNGAGAGVGAGTGVGIIAEQDGVVIFTW